MSTVIICTICLVQIYIKHLYKLFFEKKDEINEKYNKVKLYYRYMEKIAFTAPARSDVKVIYHKNMAQMSDILSCSCKTKID